MKQHYFIDAVGRRIRLKVVSRTKNSVEFAEDLNVPFLISSTQWTDDLFDEIAASGESPSKALATLLDYYVATYPQGYEREPLTKDDLARCVSYFEALRSEAVDEGEDSWWGRSPPVTSEVVLSVLVV